MSKSFVRFTVAAVAGALAITAAPSFAGQTAPRQPAPNVAEPDARGTPSRDQRVCVQYDQTGSRIPRKECKTYGEWLDQGVDPLRNRK